MNVFLPRLSSKEYKKKLISSNSDLTNHYVTRDLLQFQQQMDQSFLWISSWNFDQKYFGINESVGKSSLHSKKILNTILEPLLHRDFIYNKFDVKFGGEFKYLSTFISREVKVKLEKDVIKSSKIRKSLYRLKSAYLQSETEAREWSRASVCSSYKPHHKKHIDDKHNVTYQNQLHLNEHSHGCDPKPFNTAQNKPTLDLFYNSVLLKEVSGGASEKELIEKKEKRLYTRKSYSRHLFQNPSHCTVLRRGKTALFHKPVKSAPAAIRLTKNPIEKQSLHGIEQVFKSLPENLQTNKRYFQETTLMKSHTSSLRKISTDSLSKEQKFEIFEEQLKKVFTWFSGWTEKQQDDFLQKFLKLLEPTHLYYMYAIIMLRLYRDFISHLPESIALQILSYLKPRQLQVCAKVCGKWKMLSVQDVLWRRICRKRNVVISKHQKSYMDSYLKHKSIKANIMEGKFHTYEGFPHNQSSITCLDVRNNLLATGNTDRCIRIWKFNQKRCVSTLEGHQRTIWSVLFTSTKLLLSCSNDQTIKIWNIKTERCVRTVLGHEGAVWCLQVKTEIFASGSSDKSAKVWNLRNCSLIHSFDEHPGGVYSIAFHEDNTKLFTGSVDKIIRIWSISSGKCLYQVQTEKNSLVPVTSLSFNKGYLLCAAGCDMEILNCAIYNVQQKIIEAHKEKIECVKLHVKSKPYDDLNNLRGSIVSAGKDGKVNLWDLMRQKPFTISLTCEAINELYFDGMKIVCACQDGMVRVVDFGV